MLRSGIILVAIVPAAPCSTALAIQRALSELPREQIVAVLEYPQVVGHISVPAWDEFESALVAERELVLERPELPEPPDFDIEELVAAIIEPRPELPEVQVRRTRGPEFTARRGHYGHDRNTGRNRGPAGRATHVQNRRF